MAPSRVSAYSYDGRAGWVGRLAQLPVMVVLFTPTASSSLLSPAARSFYVRLFSLYFSLPGVHQHLPASPCVCLIRSFPPSVFQTVSLSFCLNFTLSVPPGPSNGFQTTGHSSLKST